MRRRLARAAVTVLVPVLAAACVDFADPVAPWTPNQSPQAIFQVQVTHPADAAAAPTIQLSRGDVFPGTVATGHFRTLDRESLFAMGEVLQPVRVSDEGWYHFGPRTWNVSQDSLHRVRIRLEAPPVEGIGAAPPVIDWTTPARAGSGHLTIRMGEPVVLRIDGLDTILEPPAGFQRWSIDLYGPRGAFNIGSNGVPRSTLSVPFDWVPAHAGEVATVTMTFFRDTRIANNPGNYSGYLLMLTTLQWVVRVTE